MTKDKQKRIKLDTYESEEQQEIKRFIIILVVLIVIILGIYFLTRLFVTKDLLKKEEETKTIEGSVNYNTTLIGNIFNKPVDDYYVLIYNSEDLSSYYYSTLISNYSRNKDALEVYTADLKNALNEKYYDKDNLNLNPKEIKDLRVGDITLLKISKSNIVNSYNNVEEIEKILAYKEDTEMK